MGTWGKGLGRDRSKAGEWFDKKGISQQAASKWSGLGRNTISRIFSDKDYKATDLTKRTLKDSVKRNGHNVDDLDM